MVLEKLRKRIIKMYGTQRKFAEKIGKENPLQVSYLIRGKRLFEEETVEEWAALLDIKKEEYKEYFPLVNINMDRRKMRKKLMEARQRAGMTQQQMADRLNVGLRHYQKIESGDIRGSFEIWDALEDILMTHKQKLREI